MALETLGERLRRAKKERGVDNAAIAAAAGVHPKTVSRWLNDKSDPDPRELDGAAHFLGVTADWLRNGGDVTGGRHSPIDAAFTPNPRYRRRLPPQAYATVYGHLQEMEAAGAVVEQLDEAERVMVDGAYNKLNTRDIRERTEEEMIRDIEAAWGFIRDVLREAGLKLR